MGLLKSPIRRRSLAFKIVLLIPVIWLCSLIYLNLTDKVSVLLYLRLQFAIETCSNLIMNILRRRHREYKSCKASARQ